MSSDLIKRIKELDWEHLNHAFGSAKDIPPMLIGLISDDDDEKLDSSEIFDELSNTIIHQGTIYSATCHVLPLLIEIATIYQYSDIYRLFGLITSIAFSSQHETRCMDAITRNVDVFLELYSRHDQDVQLKIIQILGYCDKRKDEIIPFLKTQINKKNDPESIIVPASLMSLAQLDLSNQVKYLKDMLDTINEDFSECIILLKLLEYYREKTPRNYLERLRKYIEDFEKDYKPLSEKIDFLIDKFYIYDALENHSLYYLEPDEFDFHDLIFK